MLPVEAETRITDFQAQTRRLIIKMRDGGVEHVLLVIAETRSNRATIDAAGPAVGELFPISPRRALQALAAGTHPGGSRAPLPVISVSRRMASAASTLRLAPTGTIGDWRDLAQTPYRPLGAMPGAWSIAIAPPLAPRAV